jgi:ribosome-binding factor A
MTYRYKGAPTNRQLRVSELIRQEIAMILMKAEVYHPALDGLYLSVLDVKTSADLKLSTIFIHPVRADVDEQLAYVLNFLVPEYRKKISNKVKLKYIPEIKFVVDKNIDDKIRMEKLIQGLTQ